jgi:hypothetical protein
VKIQPLENLKQSPKAVTPKTPLPNWDEPAIIIDNCSVCSFFYLHYCRRYPPVGGMFAKVTAKDWCGEFKRLEKT